MRKSSYISKTVSDSVLGLALLAAPLAVLAPSLRVASESAASPDVTSDVKSEAKFDASIDASVTSSHTSLGRFLESEIANRIERVSGQTLERSVRHQRSREIASAVAEASYLHDVDPFLLMAMIEVESRYNAHALGLHGEIGLMQMKPTTARWIAPVTDALWNCDLHEIRCNVMTGARYVGHIQARTEKRSEKTTAVAAEKNPVERSSVEAFREHVLRSYNLGPAKADRLASDRVPAMEGKKIPYATKIAVRADRLRGRYLIAATAPNTIPDTIADATSGPKTTKPRSTPGRFLESLATVAMTR